MARWWGTVAVALALSVLGACGWADDNYQAAQADLDQSRPVLTVKETTTSAPPLPTLAPEKIRKVPVRRATPEEVALNRAADAQARADEEAARRGLPNSRSGSSRTSPGRRPFRPAPGTTAPATIITITTTTTSPLTPLCFTVRSLQVSGGQIVMGRNADPTEYRRVVGATGTAFRRMVSLMPAGQRAVGEQVGAAFAAVEARAAASATTSEIRREVQAFMRAEGPRITEVIRLAALLCPQQVNAAEAGQAETIVIDG